MHIAFFETKIKDQKEIQDLLGKQNVRNLTFSFEEEPLNLGNIDGAKKADIVCVFINSVLSAEVIGQLPNLKFIATRSTGFDHISLEAAKQRNIKVANVPAYGSKTVAEFAFTLLLALSRKLYPAAQQVKNEHSFDLRDYEGFDLNGKTIGIIGTGKIGANAARIAKGFGMKILAFDVIKNEEAQREIGYDYVELNELLSNSDVVTLHVPYNEHTHHLINRNNIHHFKRGSYLINTCRGEVAETDAILAGLRDRTLGAFGADVLEGERALKSGTNVQEQEKDMANKNISLIDMPNVLISPHIAFFTKEAVHEINSTTVDNIISFIEGEPKNAVD